MALVEVRFGYNNGWVQARGHEVEADTVAEAVQRAMARGYHHGCHGGTAIVAAVVPVGSPQHVPEPVSLPANGCAREVANAYARLGAVFVRAALHMVIPPGASVVAVP